MFPLKLWFLETEIQRRQNGKNTSITSHKQEITAILTGDGRGTPNFVSITEHLSGHAQFTCSAQGSPCPQDDGSSSKLGGLVLSSHLASWALSVIILPGRWQLLQWFLFNLRFRHLNCRRWLYLFIYLLSMWYSSTSREMQPQSNQENPRLGRYISVEDCSSKTNQICQLSQHRHMKQK